MMDTNKFANDADNVPRGSDATDRGATSAQTRDAARLRSMMGQSNDRSAYEENAAPARTGADACEPAATSVHGRPTTMRMPATVARKPLRSLLNDESRQAREDDGDPATRLRSPQGADAARSTARGAAQPAFPASGTEREQTMKSKSPALQIEHAGGESPISAGDSSPAYVGLAVDPVPACAEVTHAGVETATVEEKMQTEPRETRRRAGINETAFADAPAYASEARQSEAAPRTVSYAAPPSTYGTYETAARGRATRRIRRPVLATTAVLAGTAIGVALYAGGGGLISSIFSRHQPSAVSDPNPSAVTERPVPPPAPAASREDSLAVADSHSPAPNEAASPSVQATVPEPVPNTPHVAATGSAPSAAHAQSAAPSRPEGTGPAAVHSAAGAQAAPPGHGIASSQPKPPAAGPHTAGTMNQAAGNGVRHTAASPQGAHHLTVNDVPEEESSPRTEGAAHPAAAGHAAVPPSAAHASQQPKNAAGSTSPKGDAAARYLVQVRATPDEAEAKLIAKRLKSRGASGVAIVKTPQKNGTMMYRVRYSATGTSTNASSAAARAGYRDVWVVKQK
ncbi:MAG TPA: SPOR domain-containing protein [Candidatus Kapabacteria bacterium]|nr:SPOR domain-containing protein [Candidatus Kapabacteria bacterium]